MVNIHPLPHERLAVSVEADSAFHFLLEYEDHLVFIVMSKRPLCIHLCCNLVVCHSGLKYKDRLAFIFSVTSKRSLCVRPEWSY